VDRAYEHVAQAIAAFERSKQVNQFTSKYDYSLEGKVQLSPAEQRGLALFEDPLKGNCAACHPTEGQGGKMRAVFTDFSYDNLGMPKNPEIAALQGAEPPVDLGLGVTVADPAENGKFKVSTLRGVAKTGPYGHNGYFKTLKDIVHFYNTRDLPEAGWPTPEYPDTMNTSELGNLGLTDAEEDDIVAFLKTLTDGYACPPCRP
jgi:cytochrome c peroxidase